MKYDQDRHNTQPHNTAQPPELIDLFGTALSVVGLNLMWVFFAGWLLFGMIPVLLFALFLNHLIDQLEDHLQHSET